MINHAFTADQITKIHNGKCEIYSAIESLKGILSGAVLLRLERGLGLMNEGMEAYYAAESAFSDAEQLAFRAMADANGLRTVWSTDVISSRMNEVMEYADVDELVYGERSMTIKGRSMTYLDLWIAADKLVMQGGDTDHIFIEGFVKKQDGALRILTGS